MDDNRNGRVSLRGSSIARDRSGDARPSGACVHAGRRRRRRGVRVRQPERVAGKFAVVAAGVGTGCGPYRNCTALRRDHPTGVPRGHCAYQRRMDRDNDGRACER